MFKFICSRLIPIIHTSHVTVDRATLLMALIERENVDVGWIIYNNIIDSLGPAKGLCFLALITNLCLKARVKVEKVEKKVKTGSAISTRASTEVTTIGGHRASTQILEELQQIKEAQKQISSFLTYPHAWIKFMEGK